MAKPGHLEKSGLTAEILRDLYEDHTDAEIAEMYDVSDVAISKARSRWGIKTRRNRNKGGARNLDTLTPEELRDLYQRMTDKQIGKLFGVSKTPIRMRRKRWGIKTISKSERYTSDEPFLPRQKEALIGSLLGGGTLLKRGVFKVSHSHHQKTYLQKFHDLLAPHSRPIYFSEKLSKSTGQHTYAFGFRTVQHVWLKELRELFYPQGSKIFPAEVLRNLSPLSLAFWYGDDGHYGGGRAQFALGDVSVQEAEDICGHVNYRFAIDVYIRPNSKDSTCKIMAVRGRHTDVFFNIVKDHLTPDLYHKMPKEFRPRGVSITRSVLTPVAERIPPALGKRCRLWGKLSEDRETLLDDLVGFWRKEGFPHQRPRPEELEVASAVSFEQLTRPRTASFKNRHTGQATCHAFARHIWEAKNTSAKNTPAELFEDDDLLREVIRFRLKLAQAPVTAAALRSALRSWKMGGVYNFRPLIAKVLLDKYCPPYGTVYDPCAGYGGRLFGALVSASRPKYIGCEPHPQGVPALREMVRWASGYIPGVEERVSLHPTTAEDFSPDEDIDVLLTSPPYWACETYCEGDSRQSSVQYPSYPSWLEGFLKSMLRRGVSKLKPGGRVILNVDDFSLDSQQYPLVADTREICEGLGLEKEAEYLYEMPRFGDRENGEPILVYRMPGKVKEDPATRLTLPVDLSRCMHCGKPSPDKNLEGGACSDCRDIRKKVCEQCGEDFQYTRSDARFCSPGCAQKNLRARKRKARRKGARKKSKKTARTFTCKVCGREWETKRKGRFLYCPDCKEKKRKRNKKSRTKTCGYRHCGRVFEDDSPRNSSKYCHKEHRRREKLFRTGKAEDLDYFRYPDPVLDADKTDPPRGRTCMRCGGEFHLKPDEKNNNTCHDCREERRHKACQECGEPFRDGSSKNTRSYCYGCSTPSTGQASVNERTPRRRDRRVARAEGGRIDDFSTLTPFTNTWWGRVGELLFSILYPGALDAVSLYGNRAPFDYELRTLGRVNVKTAKQSPTRYGKKSWSFQIAGVNEASDHAFLVGFDADREAVERAWLIPSAELPRTLKVMTPESREYANEVHELSSTLVDLMSRHLRKLLSEARETRPGRLKTPVQPDVEYERSLLGRVGEAVYSKLHPDADHVAGRDPIAPFDFTDADGTRVNVRVRRPYIKGGRDRWTFFRSKGCTADVYFFLGMDPLAEEVQIALRVPEADLPDKGFSLPRGSNKSKWLKYEVNLGLPQPLSSFVGVEKFEQVHLNVTAPLTQEMVEEMSKARKQALLNQAFLYHRAVGFPYPSVPTDKRVIAGIERVRAYAREHASADVLPVENASLGLCSAYMPHRFASRNANADFSARGAFEDDERLKRALAFCLRGKSPSLRPRSLRSSLTALNRTPTNFRPAVTAALCERLAPEGCVVFDPCAGWGGRLAGTLAGGRKYVGVDLSKQTAECLYRIGSRLCEVLTLPRDVYRIIHGDCTEVDLEGVEAEFAITSPPYWTQEVYEGSSGMSLDTRVELDTWIESFFRPMASRVASVLVDGSHFALNIADVKQGRQEANLVDMAVDIVQQQGLILLEVVTMQKTSFGGPGGGEDILVFRKP